MDGNQVLYDHDKNYSLFLLNTFLTNTNLIKKGEFILVINTLKGSLKD